MEAILGGAGYEVMSLPAATTCAISPSASSRIEFVHAIRRRDPSAAIHSISNVIG